MAKLGFFIPRTLSQAISSAYSDPEPFHVPSDSEDATTDIEQRLRRRPGWSRGAGDTLPRRVVRIGRSIITSGESSVGHSSANLQSPMPLSAAPTIARGDGDGAGAGVSEGGNLQRTIRFPDEEPVVPRAE
jgi:hypothetical protein